MARDCKKCMYFQGMHPNYSDSFACKLDPNCSWIEYKEKKVCKNYEEKEKNNMATATTEVKEEKLSFIMDDEEFLTRKGAMKEMKIGATTLAKEIKCGNIVPYDLPHGYGFSKASVREWMNNRKKKFLQKLKSKTTK